MNGWLEALKDRLPYTISEHLVSRLTATLRELESYIKNSHVSGRPEGNNELVNYCEQKIYERMKKLLEEDINEVAGLLVEQCAKIGLAISNVFNVQTAHVSHSHFYSFFSKNGASQGKRTASYIATLGFRALYLSKCKKHQKKQRDTIKGVIHDDIEAQIKFLQKEVVPVLEANMEKIIGEENA